MNQSQFLAITCNTLKAWEKRLVYGVIGFGFASHWLKIWLESFKPIAKCSDHNHAITFDSHLKTTLSLPIQAVAAQYTHFGLALANVESKSNLICRTYVF